VLGFLKADIAKEESHNERIARRFRVAGGTVDSGFAGIAIFRSQRPLGLLLPAYGDALRENAVKIDEAAVA
jgi:hypothetical protein